VPIVYHLDRGVIGIICRCRLRADLIIFSVVVHHDVDLGLIDYIKNVLFLVLRVAWVLTFADGAQLIQG